MLTNSYADLLSRCLPFPSSRRRIKEDLHPSSTVVFSFDLKRARRLRLDLRTEVTQGEMRARRDRVLSLGAVEAGGKTSGVERTRGGRRGEEIVCPLGPSSFSSFSTTHADLSVSLFRLVINRSSLFNASKRSRSSTELVDGSRSTTTASTESLVVDAGGGWNDGWWDWSCCERGEYEELEVLSSVAAGSFRDASSLALCPERSFRTFR